MRRRTGWLLLAVVLAVAVVVALLVRFAGPGPLGTAGSATPTPPRSPSPTSTPAPREATSRTPEAAATVLPGTDPVATAVAVSRALFASSPAVVLAPVDDLDAQLRAASIGLALGVPVLLTGGDGTAATRAEITRLGASDVLLVGAADLPPGTVGLRMVRTPRNDTALGRLLGFPGPPSTAAVAADDPIAAVSDLKRGQLELLTTRAAAPATTGSSSSPTATATEAPPVPAPVTTLAPTVPSSTVPEALVLSDGSPSSLAALATARAAGATLVRVPGGDPRASSATVQAVAAHAGASRTVVAVGPSFGSAADLTWEVATAATGVELPGGGQLVFPGRRMVALYGTPGAPGLGLLGEQDLTASIARARQFAAEYQALTTEPIVPAFEIIATIASRGPGPDGNYSDERAPESLLGWVQAARDAGIYVVLDLQPGRTDFLTQAKEYASLLAEPNVGLALDPEWRLAPDQVHLRQIGSVGIDEVNAVAAWLATLTREQALPQKLFVLHQFAGSMITDRSRLDLSHHELAVMVHVDGQGSQPAKAGTWAALRRDAPAGLWWGWKNFIDEDKPMLTPEQTLTIVPTPDLITYQ